MGGWYWKEWIKIFQRNGYRCVVPTLPYHKEGVDYDRKELSLLGRTGIKDYVDFIARRMRDLDKPLVIGHSMGGALAQLIGSRGLAKGVVSINGAVLPPVNPFAWETARIFLKDMILKGPVRRPFFFSWGKARRVFFNNLDEETARTHYRQLCAESGRALFELTWAWARKKSDLTVDYKKFKTPILLIGCGKDNVIPYHQVRRQYACYNRKTAAYREYPGFAHWIVGEPGWKRAAEETLKWMRNALR